ncbi:molybdopterin-guanine dinucleotide biosynthesis protein A [Pullulanibacillus pueri]|uniref:Probable molybdenum cofactor guanylyltransferase n=1 Tax=Pullulanibacillus pueri TaxID=1437324 RepID=A0A8J2ZYM9_9BACL|nr:molybdenum cofactor guanylyltransferase [Pullulanibacillus pueri]MBM7681012.1 molybdopterin-guanine dinucleotide biosynthesis protein A [Pullulanibacillus pueri]GGH86296.1 putative molybdenum cofactor guanylyltransferase [Pullulanibacillus pueri]
MTIAGVVLAGGKSSRYGKPKMFEIYQGKYFYEHSLDALKANGLSPLIIATNHELKCLFQRRDVQYVYEHEQHTYQGPLYALCHVMLQEPKAAWFFVLSSDVPFVTPKFVSEMLAYTSYDGIEAVVPIQDGRRQPLFALYHRRALKEMQQLIAQGERKIGMLFDRINVLNPAFPKEEKVFININTKQDWLRHQ